MKILVVEDDRAIAQALECLLSSYGYTIDMATDGEAGLQLAEAFEYDLVVLDVLLPKLDGISLCQQLRTRHFQTPILLLTGQGEGHQKATALNAGADDYVVKPFDAEELVARVQALLRCGKHHHPVLTWGDLLLEPSSRKVTYQTHLLSLASKEYAILELLLRNPRTVFSARSILDHAWTATESPGEEVVRVHIKGLRQKLKAVGAPKNWIKTVHRVGYQLNPLYAPPLGAPTSNPPTLSESAELQAIHEELQITLAALQVAEAELRQRNAELQQVRQTIDQEQQHYQDLFELAPDGYLVTDTYGTIQAANRAASALLGYQNLTGQPLAVFVAESEQAVLRTWLAELKVIQNWKILLKPHYRDPFPALIAVTPIRNTQNHITQLRWSLRNLRDQKQAERSLIESEEQFRVLSEISPVGIFRNDLQGRCTYANAKTLEITGLSLEENLGDGWGQNLHPEDRDWMYAAWSDFVAQTKLGQPANYQVEPRYLYEDGSIKWIFAQAVPEYNASGELVGYIGSVIDVTERKEAEAALQKSEERYRSAIEVMQEGILIVDADLSIQSSNASVARIVGIPPEHYIGCHLDDPCWQMIDEAGNLLSFEQQPAIITLRTGQSCLNQVVGFHKPDGDLVWLSINTQPLIRSGERSPYGLVASFSDITARKQAEQALQASEQRLQTILDNAPAAIYLLDRQNRFLLVNRLCAELNATPPDQIMGKSLYDICPTEIADTFATHNRTVLETGQLLQVEEVLPYPTEQLRTYITIKFPLCDATGTPYAVCSISTDITDKKQLETQFYRAQRLESLGTLASGIAHDLNNVLTPILITAQFLQSKLPNLDGQSQELLQVLEESAKRGVDLVHQILTFTQGAEGKRVPIQVADLLQEVISVVQQTFPKSISIQQNIPKRGVGLTAADSTQLHQVLMNLCVNARDAMPNGGTLILSVQNCMVDDHFAQQHLDAQVGRYVVITVADTGTGIPPKVRDLIFDPFFTTKPVGQGTGLGLSTVLGIVRSHGGFLQVSSEVGQGTQFHVYLPTTDAPLPGSSKLVEAPRQGKGELVLVVEDDAAVQCVHASVLESYHYQILVARDGVEAIAMYVKHQADVHAVLMDVMMPDIDGISAIRVLQRLNPAVKIIAMSGLSSNREAALTAGATVFLPKPFVMKDLLETLYNLINDPEVQQSN
jgi:PAS domain S-box-containing protein